MTEQQQVLPVLDFIRFESAAPGVRAGFLEELRRASREIGFFYLTGHGIDPALIEAVQATSLRFFALPDADKAELDMSHSPHFRGYTRAGDELTRGKRDWREQFDIGAERPTIEQRPGVPVWTRLQGPNQWPSALPELRSVLLRWQSELTQLSVRVLRAFSAALEQPENALEAVHADNPNPHIKIIRYPGRDTTADDQGVGPHKDSGFLTILLQDNVGGLQVETDDGRWIDAPAVPGAFVVNIGELLELATNGYLRATVHRVVTPPARRDRFSTAFFLGARLDATVPLLDLPRELAAQARGPESDPANPLFRDVGVNYLKGRLRSHPYVAQRYYRDVLDSQLA